jgi:hypothetical protein
MKFLGKNLLTYEKHYQQGLALDAYLKQMGDKNSQRSNCQRKVEVSFSLARSFKAFS